MAKKQDFQIKKLLTNSAKLAFAGGLIYWLIASGKITKEPFLLLLQKTWLIPFTLFSVLLMIVINNYRWFLLLRGSAVHTTQWRALKLSFIGMFFNLALPGSVSGDVLKSYYITRDHPTQKAKAVTSVIIDRLAGLYSIVLLAFFAVVAEWKVINSSIHLKSLGFFVLALTGGFSGFFAFGLSGRIRSHRFTNKALKKIPGGSFIEKLYDAVNSFRTCKKEFVIGVILSLFSQAQIIGALYVTAVQLNFNPNFESFYFVFPVGFMATAIPISPAGIGVGQAIFLTLFYWYTGVESTMGPTLITINQFCLAVWGMLGAWFYFTHKAQK